jgi:hypothetical protein
MQRFRRCPQSAREQLWEIHVFALLGAIRIAMLWFADAVENLEGGPVFAVMRSVARAGVMWRTPILLGYVALVLALYCHVLRGKRVAPLLLDVFGIGVIVSLLMNFVKINLLMLAEAVSPPLLLGQVITFLLFFVLAWGWLFWRLDRVAGDRDQQIVDMADTTNDGGSFDYYYSSLMSLLEAKSSKFNGVSRLGKLLVAVHSLMVLDLAAIALARFYQLVQKSI